MKTIVLTGASSGLGAALARELAAPGARLLLIGRDEARLAAVAETVAAAGAEARPTAIDVTDAEAMREAILAFDSERPVDLVVANAGISLGRLGDGPEPPGVSRRLVEVNLMGMLNTVEPLLAPMQARRRGRIALVSSIAGRRASADIPTYSATKAAVRAWGEAIRSWLRPHGVAVTVICPGFVDTPMTDRHHGPTLFKISAPRAARIMARAIRRRRGRLTFPWPWAFLLFWEQFLPARLSDWFERRAAAEVEGKG